MKKQRKHYPPEEKVAILSRHLLENEPISKRHGLYHAEGHVGGAAAGDPRGAQAEVGMRAR